MRLHVAERGQAVAEARRALIVLLEARIVHQLVHAPLHLIAFAGEEAERLVDERGIIGFRDLAGAGRAAALDLKEQAGPHAGLEISVGAGPEQEGALQRVDGAADRAGRSERSEIIAFAAPRAAMLQDLREGMVAGDEDEGEGLVVAQHDVVAGLQPLDEVGLEQQRLGLGRRGDEFHARRVGDHARRCGCCGFPPAHSSARASSARAPCRHRAPRRRHRSCDRRRGRRARSWHGGR